MIELGWFSCFSSIFFNNNSFSFNFYSLSFIFLTFSEKVFSFCSTFSFFYWIYSYQVLSFAYLSSNFLLEFSFSLSKFYFCLSLSSLYRCRKISKVSMQSFSKSSVASFGLNGSYRFIPTSYWITFLVFASGIGQADSSYFLVNHSSDFNAW